MQAKSIAIKSVPAITAALASFSRDKTMTCLFRSLSFMLLCMIDAADK
jgi:hypothetical protein